MDNTKIKVTNLLRKWTVVRLIQGHMDDSIFIEMENTISSYINSLNDKYLKNDVRENICEYLYTRMEDLKVDVEFSECDNIAYIISEVFEEQRLGNSEFYEKIMNTRTATIKEEISSDSSS